jgi:heat shock protein HslJ
MGRGVSPLLGAFTAVALVCCAGPGDRHGAAGAAAPDMGMIANAEVRGIVEPGFPARHAVRLANGVWQGAPFEPGAATRPRVQLLPNLNAAGDLDGDGNLERAVLLAASSGGSGERIYLAVFGGRGAAVRNHSTVLVGDRSKPRALAIDDGEIVLDVVEIGPREPACCATQLARHRYRLRDGGLRSAGSEVQGRLSIAVLEGEWTLVEQDGQALPAGAQPPTIVFDGTRIAGFGGCNRYGGQLQEVAPGEFAPGPHALVSTRMACEGPQSAIEDRYFAALARVGRYGFVDGRLSLQWADGERYGQLVFRR